MYPFPLYPAPAVTWPLPLSATTPTELPSARHQPGLATGFGDQLTCVLPASHITHPTTPPGEPGQASLSFQELSAPQGWW